MWFFNSKTNYLSGWFCLNSWSQTNNYNSLRLSPYPSNPLCRPSDPTPSKSDKSADITGTTESHRLRPGIPYGRRWGLRKWDGILGLQMISLVFFFFLAVWTQRVATEPQQLCIRNHNTDCDYNNNCDDQVWYLFSDRDHSLAFRRCWQRCGLKTEHLKMFLSTDPNCPGTPSSL